MTRPSLARCALPLVVALSTGACWDGWRFLFDQTPSREHRVEDLRVLAVAAEPASVLVPASFALDALPAGEPLALDLRAFVFDPRGGDVDWAMRVCARPAGRFSFDPETVDAGGCDAGPRANGTVTTRAEDPLGMVELPLTVTLDRATLRALYDEAGVEPTSLVGVVLDVQVDVVRTFNGRPERERASLQLESRFDVFDPALDDAVRDQVLADNSAAVCEGEDPNQCTPDAAVPECGNGVVEPGEQCDPPNAETGCEEGCFSFDFCATPLITVCVQNTGANERPQILGAIVSDTSAPPIDPRTPDVERGGVIEVPVGESVFVFPATTEEFDTATFQPPRFVDPSCPPDSQAAQPGLECPFAEPRSFRVYIGDGAAELTYPIGDVSTGAYAGNQFNQSEGVGVTFVDGTAAGTRDTLVLVAVDGHGGMDLAVFTIEAR